MVCKADRGENTIENGEEDHGKDRGFVAFDHARNENEGKSKAKNGQNAVNGNFSGIRTKCFDQENEIAKCNKCRKQKGSPNEDELKHGFFSCVCRKGNKAENEYGEHKVCAHMSEITAQKRNDFFHKTDSAFVKIFLKQKTDFG